MEPDLLERAEQHVTRIYQREFSEDFVYHDIEHTRSVVSCCQTMADYYNIDEHQRMILLLAAWFHDTGYAQDKMELHEEKSQEYATAFLRQHNVPNSTIEEVNACIMATKMPQSPTNLLEQIICDADLYHLGTPDFDDWNKRLRQEVNAVQNQSITKKEWRQINIEFIKRHRYFTDYAKEHVEPRKQEHLNILLEKQGKKEAEKPATPESPASPVDPVSIATVEASAEEEQKPVKEKEKEKDKQKEKESAEQKEATAAQKKTERGVVAMFRIMSENHINLSQMADSKANIMISINTIVISILVSVLLGKLQFYPEFILATVILVTICLAAIVFAILATRPNVSGGTFTKEDIHNKQINLLFFGNFFKMQLDDYDWAMKEMMKDRDYLYGSMIKDIYFLGVVLARKYKLLRISYNIFMFGLIAALLAFGITFVITGTANN